MMRSRIPEAEKDYREALACAEMLMDAVPGSPEEEKLELLALLVETYEEARFSIDHTPAAPEL